MIIHDKQKIKAGRGSVSGVGQGCGSDRVSEEGSWEDDIQGKV